MLIFCEDYCSKSLVSYFQNTYDEKISLFVEWGFFPK